MDKKLNIAEENEKTISDIERLIMIQLLDADGRRLKREIHEKNALKYKLQKEIGNGVR
jgi:hypothetical protein